MNKPTVSTHELKAHLSKYLRQVKAGAALTITENGTPIGRILPVRPSVEARMQELVQAGIVSWSGRRLSPITPIARSREPQTVAELLLEDRE